MDDRDHTTYNPSGAYQAGSSPDSRKRRAARSDSAADLHLGKEDHERRHTLEEIDEKSASSEKTQGQEHDARSLDAWPKEAIKDRVMPKIRRRPAKTRVKDQRMQDYDDGALKDQGFADSSSQNVQTLQTIVKLDEDQPWAG